MTFVSYAQNFEDVLLWRVFKHQGPGFYIDVGAGHPDTDSVTRAFYDRGWRGVNIEPVPEFFLRIEAARPRDVNMRLALGEAPGRADFFVVPGTGLSTLDEQAAEACRAKGFTVDVQSVEVATLADLCREHAQGDIHFLKIDVEGAEHAVLAGADFTAFRPWVVVVEATAPMSTVQSHGTWETGLLAAGYRFVWFDGLNRFYAAAERYDAVSEHFQAPVNVFDDAIRAADSECARRIATAESQAADLLERAMSAEAELAAQTANLLETRIRAMEGRLRHADSQAEAAGTRAYLAESRVALERQEKTQLEAALAQEKSRVRAAQGEIVQLRKEARNAASLLQSYRTSTSWRLTAPVRFASVLARGLLRRARARKAAFLAAPTSASVQPFAPPGVPEAAPKPAAFRRSSAKGGLRRSVHQFHSGSAVGDAITNSMFLVQRQLRAMGYRSEIYVEHRDSRLEAALRTLDELPAHEDYVLIAHHSMGFDAFDRVAALPAPKILMYHNITPESLLADVPALQDYARLGRDQLARWRPLVTAALADSAFNAIELQKLGFEPVAVCTLLFDIATLRARAAATRPRANKNAFTVLFVGRVIASKAQSDLIAAYAAFRSQYEGASRLVIVGSHAGAGEAYYERLQTQIADLQLGTDVTLTGSVSDDELDAWYAQADLYLSLSHHEGFGVPLVEAMAFGVPVLAWPAGAVPFTIAGAGEVLQDRAPDSVAARMLALARDSEQRARMAQRALANIERFALDRQNPALQTALILAGAAPPPDPAASALLAGNLCFTVTGHLAGSYSLAAINRGLCTSLEAAFPGRVRALPVAGEQLALADSAGADIRRLASRAAHETGPEIVISQHYPVLVPDHRGDVLLAMVFWEESLIPLATIDGLNRSFKGVLAPSAFVAKALVDSGLSIPVAIVGFAPDLGCFAALERHAAPTDGAAPFTFLHVSSCFPRKGIPALLAAYVGAFRRTDPVRLVIKSFPNPHNDAAAQVAAIRLADPDAPAIEVVDSDVSPADLLALYETADAMVLPTHGEGFNLPAAEALACGLPLIVTGHGGHMDFCDESNARLVAFRFALSGSHLATAGSVWVEPDVADLSAALKEAAARSPESRRRAEAGRLAIEPRLAHDAFAHRVAEAAVACLLMPPDRPLHIAVITSWGVRCGVAEYSRFLVEAMQLADPSLGLTIIADKRSPSTPGGPAGAAAIIPAWQAGGRGATGELQQAIAVADPDCILVQHQPGLIPWSTLGALLQDLADRHRTLIVTLHNTRHLMDVDEAERRIALDGLALASRVIVHTVDDLNRLKALGLLVNLGLLPQGAPPAAPERVARALSPGAPVLIGCCGFFLPGKGIATLIESVALLRRRWPQARLHLVNADYGSEDSAAEIAACRAAADAAGIAKYIEWNTAFLPIEQLREKLAACDVVVLPYQDTKEASSAALRTALGAGVCVAVTPIPIFDEAAQAVFRLPGNDSEAIAAGLERLLADEILRARTQEGARIWLQDRAWEGIGRRMAGLLRGICRT